MSVFIPTETLCVVLRAANDGNQIESTNWLVEINGAFLAQVRAKDADLWKYAGEIAYKYTIQEVLAFSSHKKERTLAQQLAAYLYYTSMPATAQLLSKMKVYTHDPVSQRIKIEIV